MSSVRLRGWVGILAVGGLTAVGLTPGPATATPLRRRPPVIAEIAQKFAAAIRHDARGRGASAPTEVTATRRCCGRQLLAVYHRASSERCGGVGQFGVSGGYELQLETVGQSIRQITVSSLATEKPIYHLGERAELVRPYTFSISHFTTGRAGWSSEVGFDRGTLGWGLRLPRGTKERAPALAAYRLALSVIRDTQMHARVVAMAAPWPIEGQRHASDWTSPASDDTLTSKAGEVQFIQTGGTEIGTVITAMGRSIPPNQGEADPPWCGEQACARGQ